MSKPTDSITKAEPVLVQNPFSGEEINLVEFLHVLHHRFDNNPKLMVKAIDDIIRHGIININQGDIPDDFRNMMAFGFFLRDALSNLDNKSLFDTEKQEHKEVFELLT